MVGTILEPVTDAALVSIETGTAAVIPIAVFLVTSVEAVLEPVTKKVKVHALFVPTFKLSGVAFRVSTIDFVAVVSTVVLDVTEVVTRYTVVIFTFPVSRRTGVGNTVFLVQPVTAVLGPVTAPDQVDTGRTVTLELRAQTATGSYVLVKAVRAVVDPVTLELVRDAVFLVTHENIRSCAVTQSGWGFLLHQ